MLLLDVVTQTLKIEGFGRGLDSCQQSCQCRCGCMQSEKLLAAMDLYQDAFMLVDTTVHKWRILHLNLMAANEIGAA